MLCFQNFTVSDYTGSPEILDGRVKTLHPMVHGGLLAVRGNATHESQMLSNNIKPIDMVVMNLYAFDGESRLLPPPPPPLLWNSHALPQQRCLPGRRLKRVSRTSTSAALRCSGPLRRTTPTSPSRPLPPSKPPPTQSAHLLPHRISFRSPRYEGIMEEMKVIFFLFKYVISMF